MLMSAQQQHRSQADLAAQVRASDCPLPYPVQFKRGRLAQALLEGLGWRLYFRGFPALQGMVVLYPHTSNWDFVVLLITKWALGVQVNFWAKDSLFRYPLFGAWMRWLGGIPVARTNPHGVVQQAVNYFDRCRGEQRYCWLALAPEGTRKYIGGWRSGFYRTAVQTKVPVGLLRLDYVKREISLLDFIYLSGDEATDFARLQGVYSGVTGRHPQNASPIGLLPANVPRSETVNK